MRDALAALRPPTRATRSRRATRPAEGPERPRHVRPPPRPRPAFHTFNGHILFGTTLSPRQRELLVLRVAAVRDCEYEWAQHVVLAGDAGITDDEIAAVARARRDGWTPLERALLAAVDELLARRRGRRRHLGGARRRARRPAADGRGLHRRRLRPARHGVPLLRRRARRRPDGNGLLLDEIHAIVGRTRRRMPHAALRQARRGQLDRALPRARHRARLLRGLDLARALRARARRHLPQDLAERRPGRAAPPHRQLLHQGARRRPHLGRRRAGHRRRGPRLPQHLPPPRQQARVERLPAARRRAAPAASSPASTTAGATASRATSPSCSRSRSSSTSTRPTTASPPCRPRCGRGSSS